MKISKKLLLVCLVFAVLSSGASLISVAAQSNTITNQQIQRIRGNCLSTKTTLNQLHASDALLRVNRGQIYESMSIKLMNGFNGRVSNNDFNNNSLVSVTNNYNSSLDTFRLDYKTYEEQLSSAIGIDCQKQPVSFYDAVSLARTNRNRVHGDIVKLNQYVDQYQSAVNQFEKDYLTSVEGSGR